MRAATGALSLRASRRRLEPTADELDGASRVDSFAVRIQAGHSGDRIRSAKRAHGVHCKRTLMALHFAVHAGVAATARAQRHRMIALGAVVHTVDIASPRAVINSTVGLACGYWVSKQHRVRASQADEPSATACFFANRYGPRFFALQYSDHTSIAFSTRFDGYGGMAFLCSSVLSAGITYTTQ